MKIYCTCHFCGTKIYLDSKARTRQQLANGLRPVFSIICATCQSRSQIHVNCVSAEVTRGKTPLYAMGGGAIGALAGPFGTIIGIAAGAVSGELKYMAEQEAVSKFNNQFI